MLFTIRRQGKRYVPDLEMTPEEHKRRDDAAADALFREIKRLIAEKVR